MEYIVDKEVKPDIRYCGFKIGMRRRFLDENIIKEVFSSNNSYRIPKSLKVAIDIGANIGLVSLIMARAGAVVYAFEPEQFNYDMLCHNVKINGYEDKIHCIKNGVGISGRAKLYVHSLNSGCHSSYLRLIPGLRSDRYQMVDFVSIRDVFDNYGIKYCDLLKLDCEGSEWEIINDLDDGLVNRIGQISAELHDMHLQKELTGKLSKWFKPECTNERKKTWVFTKKVLLHVGAANRYYDGFINSDMRTEWKGKKHRLDLVMDMTKPWPYEDASVDGIVGMHVFQQIDWRGLVVAFREAYRVLKKGGVLRMGCPMVEIEDRSLEYLLGWMNINLFSFDLLKRVLVDRIGFRHFRQRGYRRSRMPELAKIDNRPNRGTLYCEATK